MFQKQHNYVFNDVPCIKYSYKTMYEKFANPNLNFIKFNL